MFAIIDEQKFLLNHIAATRIVTSSIVLDCNLSPQQPAAGARADLDAEGCRRQHIGKSRALDEFVQWRAQELGIRPSHSCLVSLAYVIVSSRRLRSLHLDSLEGVCLCSVVQVS